VLTIVPGGSDADDTGLSSGSPSLIDQIVREGARRMLAEALRAEVDAYIA
jgi:putative transposase